MEASKSPLRSLLTNGRDISNLFRNTLAGASLTWSETPGRLTPQGEIEYREFVDRFSDLLQSEERYRLMFAHSPAGMMHFDRDGIIVGCNRAFREILGAPEEELIGFDLLNGAGSGPVRSAIMQALGGETARYEGDCAPMGGRSLATVKALFSTISTREGKCIGGVCVAEDITRRKRAEEALKESEKRLRDLSSRLLSTLEEERKRIAGELHDSIGQTFAAMKFSMENALRRGGREHPEEAVKLLELLIPIVGNAVEETRSICMGLRPSILDDLGILATIDWFCRNFRELYPGHCLEVETDVEEREVPEELKIAIFRVLQEALNNMAKHSRAELANVSLFKREGKIELTIEDNGVGFAPDALPPRQGRKRGLGLASMRERTELSGGVFSVESSMGEGTIVRASWPLQYAQEE